MNRAPEGTTCGEIRWSERAPRSFGQSWKQAYQILAGSLRLLWRYPVLIVPLLPVFPMVLGVEVGVWYLDNLLVVLALIYGVVYALLFSFTITGNVLLQIHEGGHPSLVQAVSSPITLRMMPRVFLLGSIWFTLVWIVVLIGRVITALLSRVLGDKVAERITDSIFGVTAIAIRMAAFMLIPIMVFEEVGLTQGFRQMKSTLQDQAIAALSGLALTKVVTLLIALIVTTIPQIMEPSQAATIAAVAFLGTGWMLTMYLEQMYVAGLYLYTVLPESAVVGILLESQIGRELPRAPVIESRV
ncbi:MAG: hypothetical protein PVJ85_02675 [Anaerolineae bacterium]